MDAERIAEILKEHRVCDCGCGECVQCAKQWRSDEPHPCELATLAAEAERLRAALEDAWQRMDRARAVLHKDENSNWGVLDTSLARAKLTAAALETGAQDLAAQADAEADWWAEMKEARMRP